MTRRPIIFAHMYVPAGQQIRRFVAVATEASLVDEHGEIEPDRLLAGWRTGDINTFDVGEIIANAFGTEAARLRRSIERLQLLNSNDRADLQHLAVEASYRAIAFRALPEIPDRSSPLDQTLVIRAKTAALHSIESLGRVKAEDLCITETADATPAHGGAE